MKTKAKIRKQGNAIVIVEEILKHVIDIIACIYMLLILVGLPFYFEEGFSHIGTDKSYFYRQCITKTAYVLVPVVICYLLVKGIRYYMDKRQGKLSYLKKKWQEIFSVTDFFALMYGSSVVLSYLFSPYKEQALWGATGWYMGMIPQLSLIAVYFLISRMWRRRIWLLALVLPASAIVFGLGFLNRFGIYPIDMVVENVQFISTIGNINWYCGYFVTVFYGGFCLLWETEEGKSWVKLLLMAYVMIGFATLVTNGSSGGILTMVVMFLIFFVLSAGDSRRMEMFWLEMAGFSVVCLVIFVLRSVGILHITYIETTTEVFTNSALAILMTIVSVAIYRMLVFARRRNRYEQRIAVMVTKLICGGVLGIVICLILLIVVNTLSGGKIAQMAGMPENSFLTFCPTWGSNRGATWMAGLMCFQQQGIVYKTFGVGPDCMTEFLYRQGSEELIQMVRTCFGTARLTNAHNEWITVLVNTGLLGFVSYVGMMTTAIKRLVSSREHNMIAAAIGFCMIAYTVNNMFSFQQSMNVSTMFVLFGAGEGFLRAEKEVRK